ncbi:MAG: hypothetical protein M0R70_12710 [Nitrospirae bacterium]|nr:hypothetical protein [Nitrospirota bacterium]
MTEEVHLNDIGTKFLVTVNENGVPLDISGATVKKIIFKKPDNTVVEKDAAFESTGGDGQIYYLSVSGDLNATGIWKLQAFVTLPAGSWHTLISEFKVIANL